MERLTFEGNFCDISQCIGEYRMTSMCEDGACDARKVWERLKEYEDLGLEPEEIRKLVTAAAAFCKDYANGMRERLQTLAQAEKEGRLFISPVKVGDMLWPICWDRVLRAWVVDDQPERVNEIGSQGFFVSATYGEPEEIDEFHPYEEIGDVYFRSREEAERALEGMKHGDE